MVVARPLLLELAPALVLRVSGRVASEAEGVDLTTITTTIIITIMSSAQGTEQRRRFRSVVSVVRRDRRLTMTIGKYHRHIGQIGSAIDEK